MTVSKETIARTIVLIIALVNQVLTVFGINPLPFSEDTVYETVTLIFTIGATAWAWWKNNSFTQEAIEADEYLAELKENYQEDDEEGFDEEEIVEDDTEE